jgi:hypothetical protein
MSCVNHDSSGGLVWNFQKSEGRWRGEKYIKLAEKRNVDFWRRKKLSS